MLTVFERKIESPVLYPVPLLVEKRVVEVLQRELGKQANKASVKPNIK